MREKQPCLPFSHTSSKEVGDYRRDFIEFNSFKYPLVGYTVECFLTIDPSCAQVPVLFSAVLQDHLINEELMFASVRISLASFLLLRKDRVFL